LMERLYTMTAFGEKEAVLFEFAFYDN